MQEKSVKIGPYRVLCYALILPLSGWATTLKLSTDIDDGKKVSGSLLKRADSIELNNGAHQIVFRVEKNVRANTREPKLYISPPLVMSFDTKK